jgi:Spy/CpxP family protein refolding chaperone
LPVLVAIALVFAMPSAIDSARWWRSPRIAAELRLSADQVQALDRIHEQMIIRSAACLSRAMAAHEEAERLLTAGASAPAIDAAAAALADAQSAGRRTRTLGLYDMFRVLTPDQRIALAHMAPASRPESSGGSR